MAKRKLGSVKATDEALITAADLATDVTGILGVANGGTGQGTFTNGQLLIGNTTGNTLTKAPLTEGAGITITNGGGSITVAAPKAPKVIFHGTTATGNVGTGEDDLITTTLPAGLLANNNEYIEVHMYGTFANNGNNKTLKAYFGTTLVIQLGPGSSSGALIRWSIKWKMWRTGATAQKGVAEYQTNNSTIGTSTVATLTASETLANALTVKCTGEGTSNDDVTAQALSIIWYPA